MTKIYTMLLQRVLTTPWILLIAATTLLTGCAGKSSPSQAFTAQAPVSQQLVITTTALPAGTYGQFFDATLQVSGGVPPYQWFAVQGDLLSIGLTLNQSTGEINGVLSGGLAFGTAPTFGVVDSRS